MLIKALDSHDIRHREERLTSIDTKLIYAQNFDRIRNAAELRIGAV